MPQITQSGFEVRTDVIPGSECAALAAALSANRPQRSRAGQRHLMRMPGVAKLTADPRMVGIACEALGGPAVPYRATPFEKSGHANWLVVWHQDTALPLESPIPGPEWGPWSTKAGMLYAHAPAWALERVIALRLHLDASTHENGPLRLIPRSHRHGVLTDEEIFAITRQQKSVKCLVPQGGVLAMRPLLIHASSKAQSGNPRRVLHIEYADSLALAEGIRLAVA